MKDSFSKCALAAACVMASTHSMGFDSFAQTGFTGLLRVPDASVIDQGDFWLNYSIEDGIDRGRNYALGAHKTALLGVGLVKGLEFTAQNTHKRINGSEPGYAGGTSGGPGSSDLSFSAKFSTKPFDPYPNFPVHFAFGVQDYSENNATFHENYYGVAEYQTQRFNIIAGYGKGDSRNQMGADYLEGPFAGIEYQLFDNLQLVSDYDGTGFNAGIKYRYQSKWLPKGWSVLANAQLYSTSDSVTNERDQRDNAFLGLELHIPLKSSTKADWKSPISVGYSKTPKFTEEFIQGRIEHQKRLALPIGDAEDNSTADLSQYNAVFNGNAVAEALSDYGFENIKIGYQYGKPVVAVENNIHNKNEVQGVGAALGIIGQYWSSAFTLILLNNGVPVIGLETRGDVVQVAITETRLPHWQGVKVFERGVVKRFNSVDWDVETASGKFKPRLQVSVNQRSSLGTEWGVIDYSLAIANNLTVDLWKGAVLDVRHYTQFAESDDAGYPGHPVAIHENHIDRILLHQAFSFDYGLMTQFSVGQVAGDFDAIFNETRWQSESGAHRVSLAASYWQHHQFTDFSIDPALLYYRYYVPGNKHGVEVFGGQFQAGDEGFGVRTLHWFGDTRVSLEFMEGDARYAGMYFEFPLMRNKSMKPHWGQITGVNTWRWGYRTSIADLNVINPSVLNEPRLEHNLDDIYYNRDRLSADYFYANLRYIFDAAREAYLAAGTGE